MRLVYWLGFLWGLCTQNWRAGWDDGDDKAIADLRKRKRR